MDEQTKREIRELIRDELEELLLRANPGQRRDFALVAKRNGESVAALALRLMGDGLIQVFCRDEGCREQLRMHAQAVREADAADARAAEAKRAAEEAEREAQKHRTARGL